MWKGLAWARILFTTIVVMSFISLSFAQEAAREPSAPPATPSTSAPSVADSKPDPFQKTPDKRVFGVLPNYRSAIDTGTYTPITARQKFIIASKDSFDYPLVFLAGALGGISQLAGQDPEFGQGMKGYARRLGTAYGDQSIGNMMTEGVFPSMLHEDPRYFLRGTGSAWSRASYALTRIFVTRTDSGGRRFNYSEVLGNSFAVAISNAYYSDGRTVSNNVAKLGEQLGTDAVSQVLKEFWPDVKRKLFRHREGAETP